MNNKAVELLEFNKIKETIKLYALSEYAKEAIDKLEPMMDIALIKKNMEETTEARKIVDRSSSIPLQSLNGIKNVLSKIHKALIFSPEELELIALLLKDTNKMKSFMRDKEDIAPSISLYALSTYELTEVKEEIERCIIRGRVDDRATNDLLKIRKKIAILEDRIKVKLDSLLRSEKYKGYLRDSLVSQRNGRYVIPVKSEYKRQIEGAIQDKSESGSTVFIEPEEVKKAQDELNLYRIEEEKEVYKILATLTNLICDFSRELNINIETLAYYDFIFAKGKYSKLIEGIEVELNKSNCIKIIGGRHPLLGKTVIPLDFEIGKNYKGVIITGPNTGGKTVALKTVGLLTMMVQSGLHVPVDKGSEFSIFADVLVDIGDGQSIEQNLSTFSSHIKNVINILNCADNHTLVIVDEIGSGTDPGEGMGLAVAILEELYNKGAIICATTHYSEIKDFANKHVGFINGSMAFDINTLKPLYKLNIGEAGESNAFLIALRLGMSKTIIERAHEVTYKDIKIYEEYKSSELKKDAELETEDHMKLAHEEQIDKFKKAEKNMEKAEKLKEKPMFNLGDCVYVSFMNRTGIICESENSKGEFGVLIMKKKFKINKKRLSLYIEKDELYPEEYDFDIVFKSKEYRKKNKLMNEKHVNGTKIEAE